MFDYEQHFSELAWTATNAVVPILVSRFRELGVNASCSQVRTFLIGGGAPDFSGFIGQLESTLGYDSSAMTYEANEKFWQKLGVTVEMYLVFVAASN